MASSFTHSGDFGDWTKRKFTAVRKAGREAMEDATEYGEENMRFMISTRGTEKSGKRGRIETGKMAEKVNHRIDEEFTQGETYVIRGSFGWDESDFADERTPIYPLLQEQGFPHTLSGGMIEPMFALGDSILDARRFLVARFDRALKENQ